MVQNPLKGVATSVWKLSWVRPGLTPLICVGSLRQGQMVTMTTETVSSACGWSWDAVWNDLRQTFLGRFRCGSEPLRQYESSYSLLQDSLMWRCDCSIKQVHQIKLKFDSWHLPHSSHASFTLYEPKTGLLSFTASIVNLFIINMQGVWCWVKILMKDNAYIAIVVNDQPQGL